MKKEPHNQDLQPGHTHHHAHLHQTELKNPPLRTPHRTEITILPRAEILLHPIHCAQLRTDSKHGFFERGMLFGRGSGGLLGQGGRAGLVLDGDLHVDHLFGGEGGRAVGEAEAVFAGALGGEDVVALALFELA